MSTQKGSLKASWTPRSFFTSEKVEPYRSGHDFIKKLTLLMSAIMLQDWPTPGNLFEQEKVSSVKEACKEAIGYGSVRDPDTGLNIPLQTSDGNVETTCSPNDSALLSDSIC